MKTLPAGEFKQTCLRVLDEVRETGTTVVITKRGKPVAQLCPLPEPEKPDWFGAMSDRTEILGDIVAPAAAIEDWDALEE